jgi:hypothetical protein
MLSFDLGTKSMGYAFIEEPCKVRRTGIINLGVNHTPTAIENLYKMLCPGGELEWIDGLKNISIVLESQPEHGAPKCVAHVLQMYGLMHGHEVIFMAPNDKLKVIPQWYREFENEDKKARKNLAISICLALLHLDKESHKKVIEFYHLQPDKQRTDIADAIVQGVRALQRRGKKSSTDLYITQNMDTLLQSASLFPRLQEGSSSNVKDTSFRKRAYGQILEAEPLSFNE